MSQSITDINEYDGFFFTPFENDDGDEGVTFKFFCHNKDSRGEEVIPENPLGKTWHVVLFNEKGQDEDDYDTDYFEAVLGSPEEYATNLSRHNIFGCIVKKTDKSKVFVDSYLESIRDAISEFKNAPA
jgi:hypothetical protein